MFSLSAILRVSGRWGLGSKGVGYDASGGAARKARIGVGAVNRLVVGRVIFLDGVLANVARVLVSCGLVQRPFFLRCSSDDWAGESLSRRVVSQ